MAMDNTGKIIRISFLDFRKAFDLIDHTKLSENFTPIGVRLELIGWLGSYLRGRSQITTFRGEQSDLIKTNGGVPHGSKLGPTAFIIKVNELPTVSFYNERDDTIMFWTILRYQRLLMCPITYLVLQLEICKGT